MTSRGSPEITPGEVERLGREATMQFGATDRADLLGFRENIVFRASLPHHENAAIRLHRPGYQSRVAIESELWFMNALVDSGLSVPRPIRTADGRMLAELSDGRLASALSWVDGEPFSLARKRVGLDRSQLADMHRKLGATLARLHIAADSLSLPDWFTRPDWNARSLLGRDPIWGRFWEHRALVGKEVEEIGAARDFLIERLTVFGEVKADRGLIHADVLPENVFCHDGEVALIDFDDCGFGYRLYDLGTALCQELETPEFKVIRDAKIEGYNSVRCLEQREIDMIACFTLLRSLASIGWTRTRLSEKDPRNRTYIERALRLADPVMRSDSFA